jgi:Mn-containing catalase
LREAELHRDINKCGESHTKASLGSGGTALFNPAGVPWTAAYVDTIGEPTAGLCSNIAAEACAKIIYKRLIAVTDNSGIKNALRFLTTREVVHQKSFEKALHSIQNNLPPGKFPGKPVFTAKYYDISQGSADGVSNEGGAWNQSEEWEYVKNREDQYAVDGGDGSAMAELPQADGGLLQKAALHTKSKTDINPTTGTDLGAGPGAGQTKKTP